MEKSLKSEKPKRPSRAKKEVGPTIEMAFGHPVEELNKVSQGYILKLFSDTQCPARLAYDVKLLEKHLYEIAMKLFYFHDTNSMEFRALVLDTHKLFTNAKDARIKLYKETGV